LTQSTDKTKLFSTGSRTAYHGACSQSANCEMRKHEICLSVKCETKCRFCVAFFKFLDLRCLTATTDQPTDGSD